MMTNNLDDKFNQYLILLFVFAPFVAYVTIYYLNIDFNRSVQLLSYIGALLILIFKEKKRRIIFPKYLIFYLFFILYVFYSDLILLERVFKVDYLFSNSLIGTFNMMFILENMNVSHNFFRSVIKYSKLVLIIAFVTIIIQQVYDPNFFMRPYTFSYEIYTGDKSTVRLYSIYSWFDSIKSAGFSFIPIFLIVFEDLKKNNKRVFFWLILGAIFSFLTKQRWIMINFSLVFFLFYIYSNIQNITFISIRIILLLSITLAGLFITLDIIGIDAKEIVENRILEVDKKDLNQKSAGTRLLAFKAFNTVFWESPILGAGNIKYGMGGIGKQDYKLEKELKGRSSQIHVGYLSIPYMYGIIGSLLFFVSLFLLLNKLFFLGRYFKVWGPFLGIFGVVLDNFVDVHYTFFLMGFIVVFLTARFYAQKTEY